MCNAEMQPHVFLSTAKKKRRKRTCKSGNRFSKDRQSDEFAKFKKNILPKKPLMKKSVKPKTGVKKNQGPNSWKQTSPSTLPTCRSSRLGNIVTPK